MKVRIVRDRYSGYEVQFKHWFWPFWLQANFCNTHSTLESARKYAKAFMREGEFVEMVHPEVEEPR